VHQVSDWCRDNTERSLARSMCLAPSSNPSRRRRRPRPFFGWLVQANLSPMAFSIQAFFHPGEPPPSPTQGRRHYRLVIGLLARMGEE
jgi:hypothetical protein